MPLLSSPVSTTVAALRQYWRCLMPVPASPLAYTDGWRCLLSRTTQITEDQLHLQGGEDPLPRAVARIRADPPPLPATLGAGQPMFRSIQSGA